MYLDVGVVVVLLYLCASASSCIFPFFFHPPHGIACPVVVDYVVGFSLTAIV